MRTKLLLFIIAFLFLTRCSKKENININNIALLNDSLAFYFEKANDDNLSIQQKKVFNKRAFDIVSTLKNDSLSRTYLFKVANRYFNIRDWQNFKRVSDEVLIKSLEKNDSVFIAKSYTYIGDYFSSNGVSDSAYVFYSKAEKLYSKINDKNSLARVILNKALLQFNEDDYLGSERAVIKALRAVKGNNSNDIVYDSNNLLGIIYNELEEYDKSIEYHTKALENATDDKIPAVYQSKATSLNNIGYVYQNLKNYQKAQEYYQEGLKQNNLKYDKPALYAMLLDNLAYSRFKLNEENELPELFLKSLKLRDSLKLTSGIVANKIHLSEYYTYHKDSLKALHYAREALQAARNDKNFRNVLVALKQMGVVEPRKASLYSKEYIHINDSLQKAERKMGEKFSRIEYETDVIKSENTDLVVQNRNLFYVFSFLTLLGAFIFLYISQRNKHRVLLFKEQQQVANAQIYDLLISQQKTIEENRTKEKKRVARELHDGVLGKMFGVRMNLDSMNRGQDEQAIKSRLEYLAELKQIEQDIREISHDLNRENTELINNFVVILTNLIENQKKAFKTKVKFTLDKEIDWGNISNEIKINLYRMVQEGLQNCNKYAKPSLISIEFKKISNPDQLQLVIADDGVGFNLKRVKKGIGLQNIEFRTKECNGTLDINTKKGEGTTLTILVPLESINSKTNS
ncbi:tetratricopeptide repeat-containing sensor histidine kinase [Flavobacterium sp. RSSA_27]|uniref:tetratricopeptide repeat-containing sensor histidine kinase n=1 Tax=Flavobacterium sp. RSSA_27 TaxID=3447667 RepID=UPI003F4057BB